MSLIELALEVGIISLQPFVCNVLTMHLNAAMTVYLMFPKAKPNSNVPIDWKKGGKRFHWNHKRHSLQTFCNTFLGTITEAPETAGYVVLVNSDDFQYVRTGPRREAVGSRVPHM
jgi:hypothetical protein